MENSSSQLKAGVLISYFSLVISVVIPLFYTPYFLRMLGMEEYGLFNLTRSFTVYLGLLSLGIGGGVVKFISQAIAENNLSARNNYFTLFFCCYAVISVPVLLVGAIVTVWATSIFGAIPPGLHFELRVLIGVVSLNAALSLFVSLYASVILAQQRFIFYKIIGLGTTLIVPALSVLCLWLGFRSIALVWVIVGINVMYGGIAITYAHRVLGVRLVLRKIDISPLRSIFHYSKYIFLAVISYTLYGATDIMILGAFGTASAIAVYSIGVQFSVIFKMAVDQISALMFPKINTMVVQGGNLRQLDVLILKVGRLQYMLLGLVLSGFITLGDRFINLWVGKEYESSYWIALLVMVPLSVPLLQNSAVAALMAMNRHGFRAWILLIIAVLNVMGSLWAVERWGALGCAAVTGIASIIGHTIIMNVFYQKVIGLDILSFWKDIFRMSGAFATMLILGLAMKPVLPLSTWGSFFTVLGCFTVTYLAILWLTGMNRYEKDLVLNFVSKVISIK